MWERPQVPQECRERREKPLARGSRGRFLRRVGTELRLEQWVGFECEKSHFPVQQKFTQRCKSTLLYFNKFKKY